jgi:hypothetical protein
VKKNKTVALILASVLCTAVFAQVDPVSLKIDDSHVLLADFTMDRYLAQSARNISSQGSVSVTTVHGICWNVTHPVKKSWYIQSSKENQQISDTPMSFITGYFTQLIRGNYTDVEKSFRIAVTKKDDENGKMFLHPRDENLSKIITLISIKIESGFISSLRIVEKTGGSTFITFFNTRLEDFPEGTLSLSCNGAHDSDRKD